MSWMFYHCSSLTELNLSNFYTENVEYMISMFNGCTELTKLDLSNFNTKNVTNMSGMFYDCYSLTELDLSGFDFSKVGNMNEVFMKCKIKNLFLPQKYKDIRKRCICCGYVYINCEAVVGLNPNNVVFVDGVAG
jgi:surface protein